MHLGKLTIGILCLSGWAIPAQIVPDLFVVELNERPVERTRGARRVREAQGNVRAAMAARMGARAEVKDSIEVVMNALIVRSAGGEAELAALPGVSRVWPVYEVHPELNRAVGLHRIREAWEAVGGAERAGAGIRIGILDSGLDLKHPGFQPVEGMTAPEGFPKATTEDMRAQLNAKVIVYRTYEQMAGFVESAVDNSGHGTGVAMVAAGVKVESPLAEIQGAAPGAHLGIYKVFVGPNGGTSNTAIVTRALDDAAADGMDVVNLSFGFLPQARPEIDPLGPPIDRAAALGTMFVKSNGNSGPVRLSGSTPGVGTSGLTVGASWTDRIFASGLSLNGGAPVVAVPGDGPAPDGPVKAPMRDLTAVDPSGLACAPLPAGSLAGVAVLILRGDCTFEAKIRAAQAAGAVAAIIYTHAASPNAAGMLTGGATLPAVMISNRDGLRVKAELEANPESTVEVAFSDTLPFIIDSDGISSFSSRGPGSDGSIRPDLLAVGEEVLTAAQKNNPNGEVFDASGYTLINGTSFASPLVAGAYAVLKAGRPGMTPAQYRSLLVSTAQPFPAGTPRPAPVMVAGAGRMDLQAALRAPLVASLASISFGFGGPAADRRGSVTVENRGPVGGTWKVEVDSGDEVKLTAQPETITLESGGKATVDLRLSGEFPAGEYQGFLLFRREGAEEGERPQRIPYWYGVPTLRAASITIVPSAPATGAAGASVSLFALITDAIGAAVLDEAPKVTVLEGSGSFTDATSEDARFPGYWSIRLRLGSASGETNRFRIESGAAVREVSIRTR